MRQETDLAALEAIAEFNASGFRRKQPGQPAQECGLAGTVFSDDAQIVPGVDFKTKTVNDLVPVISERKIPTGEQSH